MDAHYTYPIHAKLTDCPLSSLSAYTRIHICAYRINQQGNTPFLEFLLSNHSSTSWKLPVMPSYASVTTHNLVSYASVFLSGILMAEDFGKFDSTLVFKGVFEDDRQLYMCYDLTSCALLVDETYSYNAIRFALTDELVNHWSICNMDICPTTARFFTQHTFLHMLYDKQRRVCDIPVVGYVGKSTVSALKFTLMFGETAKNNTAIMGPYFYFTDFHHAVSHGEPCGVVRFALFMGNIKCVENSPNDPIDTSSIKQERLHDTRLNPLYEQLTLRISDHDGLWADTFDSVCLSVLELDNGETLAEGPWMVVKEHVQQTPLSMHFIKNRTPPDGSYQIV